MLFTFCCWLQEQYFHNLGVSADDEGLQQQQQQATDSRVQLMSSLPSVSV